MWLLRTELHEDGSFSPVLEEFEGQDIPAYAILSHTWDEEEVLFADVLPNPQNTSSKKGSLKIGKAAERARLDGYTYIWIDTCCIRKESSAELQEAINSMYTWYERAAVCYAYLADFRHLAPYQEDEGFQTALQQSRWFTRGWCLQELLAPRSVIFFSSEWTKIGTKASMAKLIASITSIDVDYLTRAHPIHSASVAKRMSWAAHRQTRRIEDTAYCLMGIFSVNMPMLYGEGSKAFLRLQERIWKEHEDQSLFMWFDPNIDPDTPHGLLADSPAMFAQTGHYCAFEDKEGKSPLEITSKGVRIHLRMQNIKDGYKAALNCPTALFFRSATRITASIYLRKLDWGDEQFVRVRCNHLSHLLEDQGSLQTVFIPQKIYEKNMERILYPKHIIHFRKNSAASRKGFYTLIDMVYDASVMVPVEWSTSTSISSELEEDPYSVSRNYPRQLEVFSLRKLTVALLFRRRLDGEQFVILLSIGEQSLLGFCAFQTSIRKLECIFDGASDFQSRLNGLSENLEPMGSVIQLQWHRVEVFSETQLSQSYKITNLDFNLEAIWKNEKIRASEINASSEAKAPLTTEPAFQFRSSKKRTTRGIVREFSAVAFSPDGKQIVSATSSPFGASIWLWDLAKGTVRGKHQTISSNVLVMAFSPDGSQIICVSDNKTMWLWDSAMRAISSTCMCDSDEKFSAVVFSPDRKQIASAPSDRGPIHLWDSATGAASGTLECSPYDYPPVIAFSPDGSQIASVSYEAVDLLKSVTGAVNVTLRGHSDRISAVVFSPNGKQVASASRDGTIRLWNSLTGEVGHIFEINSSRVRAIAFSPELILSVITPEHLAEPYQLQLWNPVTGAAAGTLDIPHYRDLAVAFSPDGKLIATTGHGKIWIWTLTMKTAAFTRDKMIPKFVRKLLR
jgi:WD40 repeat protein